MSALVASTVSPLVSFHLSASVTFGRMFGLLLIYETDDIHSVIANICR